MEFYRAIKYIRLSYTDDRNTESDSVGNQRRMIDDFIAKHPEIDAVAEKIDDGYSGVLFDRPAFQEMMQMIQRGEANCVIVKDLSRLGREYIETGRYMRRIFPAYGVRFIAINDNVDTINDGADDLAVSVKNIMNEAYSRDISIKTRSALEAKRKNGDFVGAFTVYGYRKTGERHKKLEIDEYAASVVRSIFQMKLDGHSAKHIADELNAHGVLSPLAYKKNYGLPYGKGGYADCESSKWSATTIIRILRDETYTGTLVQGKQTTPHFKLKNLETKPAEQWDRVENAHDAIVSKQDFQLVQRLNRIDTRTSPKESSVYLFSGVLICGCCGGRMTRKAVTYQGYEYQYYYCPNGKKHGCENPAVMKQNDLIACVQEMVKKHIDSVTSMEAVLSSINQDRINQNLIQEYKEQMESCEQQMKQVSAYRSRLYENLVNGFLTKEECAIYKQQYNEEYDRLKAAVQKWQEKIQEVMENRSERNHWIQHFKQFAQMEKLDRRAVVHLIRSIKVIGKSEIQITFNYQDEYRTAAAFAAQIKQEAV